MKLYKSLITQHEKDNSIFFQHSSENNQVLMWIHPVMYGVRIQISTARDYESGYSIEYCAGAAQENVEEIWSMLCAIFEKYNEEDLNNGDKLRAIFPIENRRPNKPGMEVFEKLKIMAGQFEVESIPSIAAMRMQTYEATNFPIGVLQFMGVLDNIND